MNVTRARGDAPTDGRLTRVARRFVEALATLRARMADRRLRRRRLRDLERIFG
jgi:hypothetical protein